MNLCINSNSILQVKINLTFNIVLRYFVEKKIWEQRITYTLLRSRKMLKLKKNKKIDNPIQNKLKTTNIVFGDYDFEW